MSSTVIKLNNICHLLILSYYLILLLYFIFIGLVLPLGRARAASPFATVVFNAGLLSRVQIIYSMPINDYNPHKQDKDLAQE